MRKAALAIEENLDRFVKLVGVERVGFLTLTFADNIIDPKEAQRRFHSLVTGVLSRRYGRRVRVYERQKQGRIHYHVVVELGCDIRAGFNFRDAKQGIYRSANAALRAEWAFWRKASKLYGFGRTELLPIEKPAAIGRYVGKYIGKHFGVRQLWDKGVRLVQYSAGWRCCSTRFAFHSVGGWLWRQKLRQFAALCGCASMEQMRAKFGSRWAYRLREAVMAEVLSRYPTIAHARADGRDCDGLPSWAVDLHFA